MIQISHLTIRFPGNTAVDDISTQFEKGRIYGLSGPNGAGKSSFIKAMVGLISEYEGEIKYGPLVQGKDRYKIKSQVGYGPEDPELFLYLTGRELLQMIADIRHINIADQISALVADLGLEEKIDDLIAHYSHGMRQKISFATAVIGHPQYLILDEAINGFDPVSMTHVRRLLNDLAREGSTIIIASHVLELIEQWCDQMLIMHRGKILAEYSREQIALIRAETGRSFADHFVTLVGAESVSR